MQHGREPLAQCKAPKYLMCKLPITADSDAVGSAQGLRSCISKKLPGDVQPPGPQNTYWIAIKCAAVYGGHKELDTT